MLGVREMLQEARAGSLAGPGVALEGFQRHGECGLGLEAGRAFPLRLGVLLGLSLLLIGWWLCTGVCMSTGHGVVLGRWVLSCVRCTSIQKEKEAPVAQHPS